MANTRRLRDALAAHPAWDWVPVALSVALGWWALQFDPLGLEVLVGPGASDERTAFYGGVATVASLALAAETFACTMTYQSSNFLMSEVHRNYARELRRNWRAILGSTLVSAVLAVLMVLGDFAGSEAALTAVCGALALAVIRAFRAFFWLRLTLFMEEAADLSRPLAGPAPRRDASNSSL